jgi:hypothetical protein
LRNKTERGKNNTLAISQMTSKQLLLLEIFLMIQNITQNVQQDFIDSVVSTTQQR